MLYYLTNKWYLNQFMVASLWTFRIFFSLICLSVLKRNWSYMHQCKKAFKDVKTKTFAFDFYLSPCLSHTHHLKHIHSLIPSPFLSLSPLPLSHHTHTHSHTQTSYAFICISHRQFSIIPIEIRLSCVATVVFSVRLLHAVSFSKQLTLIGWNQYNYFESATACSKRALKTTVATQLKSNHKSICWIKFSGLEIRRKRNDIHYGTHLMVFCSKIGDIGMYVYKIIFFVVL